MVRHTNKAEFILWKQRIGRKKAIEIVMTVLGCGSSKAQKIVDGRYPSLPVPLEQKALAVELGKDLDTLFRPVTAGRKRAS